MEEKEIKKLRCIPTNDKVEEMSKNLDELCEEMEDIFESINKYENKVNKYEKKVNQTQKVVNGVNSAVRLFMKEMREKIGELVTKMNKQEEVLKKSIETNEMVEDTLMNILLAIRQNEYLQAWYPAQQGHSEMKVVGRHPLQARSSNDERDRKVEKL